MRADRLKIALVAAFTSAAVLIGPNVASAATGLPAGNGAAATGPGSVLWTSMVAGNNQVVAADPKGGMVFVTGSAGLVAYDAGTGKQLWDNAAGTGLSVALTPNGSVVFVIQRLTTGGGGSDFLTSAFDAATGNRVWAKRYSGCPKVGCVDIPAALAVSAGGDAVFVTGTSKGRRTSGFDYATVAYSAATGKRLWVSRYNGHGRSTDSPAAIAVSPRGGAVFVTGTSAYDFATVAYRAATGATLWTKRYDRAGGHDFGTSVAVSPDGRRVFVTGASEGRTRANDIATLAYAAASGSRLWVRRIRDAYASAVFVSPLGGGTVLVAGTGDDSSRRNSYFLAVAYGTVTGRTKWVFAFSHLIEGQGERVFAEAISPDGRSLYLNGSAGEPLTVAANVATGAVSWYLDGDRTVTGPVAVSPDGGTIYLVGGDIIEAVQA